MAATFKINPEPTFKALVTIPVPGGKPMALDLEFRHKKRDELKTWFESFSNRTEAECLMDVIVDWHNCDMKFDQEALELVLQNYTRAAAAILGKYTEEVTGAKLGN